MEGLKVNLLVSDENVAVDVIEGQNLSGEYAVLFQEWLLRDTVDFAHVKGFFVEFVNNHPVDALLQQIVILLFASFKQKGDPLLKVLYIFVRRVDS